MATIKKYRFVNNNRSIKRVIDFLQYQRSPVFQKYTTSKQFLDEVDENNVSNFQRILNSFVDKATIDAINNAYSKGNYDNIVIPYGIEFVATQTRINISNYAFQGLRLITESDSIFKAHKLVELEASREYVKVDDVHSTSNSASGKLVRQLSQVTVWMWCRALNKMTKLFDASPFILDAKTSVTLNGGAFSLQLPPLTYRRQKNSDGELDWVFDNSVLSFFNDSKDFLSKTPLFKVDQSGNLFRNDFFFHDAVQKNDLVFIRFETLKIEKNKRSNKLESLVVDTSQLPGQIFDMIGLVDDVRQLVNSESNSCTIHISGRDLVKLLIDDGSYFFPFEVAGANEYFASGGKNNELTKRIFTGGGSLTSFDMNGGELSIVEVINFVIQQLSNITICPQEILQAYPESGIEKQSFSLEVQTQNKNVQQKNTQENYIAKALNSGIWRLFNIVTDEFVDQRVVVDSSLSTATGSLLNFIQAVCQKEFFELSFDTYGDQFYMIIRKPPFDQKSFSALLNNSVKTKIIDKQKRQLQVSYEQGLVIDIEDHFVFNEQLSWETESYSWYHLSPRQNILGSQFNLNFIPAVFLPEYAEIWGSNPYMTQHNYVNFFTKTTADSSSTIENLVSQCMIDLKFLIETTCYLPFTRTGTITILGDRRIKRGNFIRYKPTGEIFYVDSVTQDYSNMNDAIVRTTTIQVSRGMVEKYIFDPVYSYFKILNLKKDIKYKTVTETVYETKDVVVNQAEVNAFKATLNTASANISSGFNTRDDLNPFKQMNSDGTLKIFAQPSFLEYSPNGVAFTKQWETFVDHAYWDGRDTSTGIDHYSIGYGHQIQPAELGLLNKTITEPQASTYLYNDVNNNFAPQVKRLMLQFGLTLNQNQFDAAVDFTYTTGTLWNSMCQKIKLYTDGKITDDILITFWTNTSITQQGSSIPLQKLVERRKAEVALFLGKSIAYVNEVLGSNPQPIIEQKQVPVGTKTNKIVDRDDFFKNFVVNKDVFNFFLQRRQKNII